MIRIEDLKIGQVVYNLDGEERIITELRSRGHFPVTINGDGPTDIRLTLSQFTLTPPKKLKRYFQWKLDNGSGWFRRDEYICDNGQGTGGYDVFNNWSGLEKIKIENDYIDVEV